jgi:ribonuclease E
MVSESYESDSAGPRLEEVPASAPTEPAPEKTKRRRHRGGRGRGKKAGAAQPAEGMVSESYESDSAEPQLVAQATPVLTEAEPLAERPESPQGDEAAKKSAPRRRHRSHRKKATPPAEAGAPSGADAPPEAGMIREDALAYMPSEATAAPPPAADASASVEQSAPSAPAKKPRRRYYKPRKKKEADS